MTIRLHGMTHRDIVVTRPLEHGVAVLLLVEGTRRLLGAGVVVAAISNPAVAVAWAAVGVLSALAILVGMHMRSPIMGRALEAVGWSFAAATFLGGAATVLLLDFSWDFVARLLDEGALGIAAVIRVLFLRRETRVNRALREQATRAEE